MTIAVAALLCGPVACSLAAFDFAPAASIGTGSIGNADVAAGDLDQDGDPDLVVASCGSDCGGSGSGGTDVLTNDGTGSFAGGAPVTGGQRPHHVALADLNNDGDPDLIVGHQDGIDVRLGAAGATFGSNSGGPNPTSFNYAVGPGSFPSIAVGDINRDGKLDVVNANRDGPNNIQVRLGDGTGALGAPTNYSSGTLPNPAPYAVVLVDVNFTGLLDIVVANSAEGTLTYRKQASGAFNTAQTIGTQGHPVSLAPASISLGAPTDMVVANRTSSLGVLLNPRIGSPPTPYLPIRTYATGSPTLAVAAVDLQDFGALTDVVSRQQDGSYALFLNTGGNSNPLSHQITLTGLAQPADADSSVLAVDVNGDGALDLLGTNYGAGLTLFRQLPVPLAAGIDFDDQAVGGRSAPRAVTVSNPSAAPLEIASDAVTGADAGDFVVISDGCAGATLGRTESCSVVFRFKPSALGARTASLTFTDNGRNGGRTLPLSGVGVAPASSVTGPAGPTGADGSNGVNGGNGANGSNGAVGANGANGSNGAVGANGANGQPGAAGPQGDQGPQGGTGPAGPRGPAGRDSRVTCKPGKRKNGRVSVTCTVRFVTSGAARARLSRKGVVYAHGSGRITRHAAALDLRAVRQTPPGRYTLRVRFGRGQLVKETVTIR